MNPTQCISFKNQQEAIQDQSSSCSCVGVV